MNINISKNNYSRFIGILLTAVMCTVFYNLSMVMPVVGFGLLVYKIKNVSMTRKTEWILTTLISIIFIGGINLYISPTTYKFGVEFFSAESLKNLAGYILIFLPIEILYYVFNIGKIKIPVFDRIIITSMITTITAFLYIKMLNIDESLLKAVIAETNNLDKQTVEIIFKFMKENAYYLVYTYIGFITYTTYYYFGKKSYPRWRISYQWLLLYIIPFFLIRFGHIQNLYLTNMMLMVKISFVVYGTKIVYNFMKLKIKSSLICQIMALILCFNFQNITFIIAGLLSFEAVRVTIIKNNGGK
ncbi:hypothetical protein [Fusobacterium sp.]|uniref:hypothetical protein n=1 Tax=Fusobacterium sp. TaxID=68766 RepID=UPI002626C669|nr:hypothetical protein [Fusobacterium sp.]